MENKTYTITKITLTEDEYKILTRAKELCHNIYCESNDPQLDDFSTDAEDSIQNILKLIVF